MTDREFQLQEDTVAQLAAEIDGALDLLREFACDDEPDAIQAPATLLDQCLELCAQHQTAQPEPIRMVHHFACTGGTLFGKCIAAMPNVQLLSEVDPLSTLGIHSDQPQFAPTDMVTLMRQSTRGASPELLVELFLDNLGRVYAASERTGLHLVLRDHAHSHFCTGAGIPDRPSLRAMLASRYPTLSVLTVRHPIESYLSLKGNGWLHFSPPDFDEYCLRYIGFLRAHEQVAVIRYEDLTSEPEQTMARLCRHLDLPFNPDFPLLFDAYKLTGDSGRSGDTIEPRPRKGMDAELREEIRVSRNYGTLISMLDYDWLD